LYNFIEALNLQLFQGRQQMQYEQEAAEFKTQIHSLRTQHEAAVFEVKQKEERIQHLLREIQNLVGINIHYTTQIKI